MRSMTKFQPRLLLVRAVVALALVAASAPSFAQYRERDRGYGGDRRMSREERQRLRDDMHSTRRDAYRDPRQREYTAYPPPPPPPPGGYRMSPEDREQLRRDMYEANRGMPRR
jgi:hypothetical protein